MADKKTKTPMHKHAHIAYGWIALIVSVGAILSVAGWYFLKISDGYNDDMIYAITELSSSKRATSAVSTSRPVDVAEITVEIDQALGEISEDDFSETQLDNAILGIE